MKWPTLTHVRHKVGRQGLQEGHGRKPLQAPALRRLVPRQGYRRGEGPLCSGVHSCLILLFFLRIGHTWVLTFGVLPILLFRCTLLSSLFTSGAAAVIRGRRGAQFLAKLYNDLLGLWYICDAPARSPDFRCSPFFLGLSEPDFSSSPSE